jgi:hypothetical protein
MDRRRLSAANGAELRSAGQVRASFDKLCPYVSLAVLQVVK